MLKSIGLLSIVVADLVGYTGAGIGLGWYLTKYWSAPWWCLLLTSIAGLTLAFYQIYKVSKKLL